MTYTKRFGQATHVRGAKVLGDEFNEVKVDEYFDKIDADFVHKEVTTTNNKESNKNEIISKQIQDK